MEVLRRFSSLGRLFPIGGVFIFCTACACQKTIQTRVRTGPIFRDVLFLAISFTVGTNEEEVNI